MTKKSAGRQLRDKVKNDFANEFSGNTNWTDLQSRHHECVGLISMHMGVVNILERPEIMAEITPEEDRLLTQNVRLLTKDLAERQTELGMIYKTHHEKTGAATEDNIMLSFEIMERYTLWLSLMQSNVQPTVNHILEITSVIEKRLIDKQSVIDPSVTTDVVYQETPSSQTSQAIDTVLERADHTKPQPE